MDDYYSQIADSYDALHGEEQDTKLQEFLQKVTLEDGARLLDVGCGTGRSRHLLSNVEWEGIEPSQGLIAQANPAVQELIVEGVGEELPFANNSFDIILSLTALQNFDDPEKGLDEMSRVVKEGGLLLISFLKKSPKAKSLLKLCKERLSVQECWEQQHDVMIIAKG